MGRFAQDVRIEIQGKQFVVDLIELDSLREDILIGYTLLTKYQPFVLRTHEISLKHIDGPVRIPSLKLVNHKLSDKAKQKKEPLKSQGPQLPLLLEPVKAKFEQDCCSMNPLQFWSKEHEECEIRLKPECKTIIPFEPTYLMSPTEVKEMDEHLNELIEGKFIRESKSPFSCPAFLVNKRAEQQRGKKRFCITINL